MPRTASARSFFLSHWITLSLRVRDARVCLCSTAKASAPIMAYD